MKIKPEHLKELKERIQYVLEQNPQAIELYETGQFRNAESTKDLQKRFCFDLLHAGFSSKWVCDTLYPYMNDAHIYTALKSVCPKIERRY